MKKLRAEIDTLRGSIRMSEEREAKALIDIGAVKQERDALQKSLEKEQKEVTAGKEKIEEQEAKILNLMH